MTDLRRDPINNVILNQIKRGIRVSIENKCYASAVILIYSGIDTMAYLDMPKGKIDVTRGDFVRWVDEYIHFPCREQISGLEFYGARCAMLHTHSIYSRLSRKSQVRTIGYMDRSIPEIRYDPSKSKDFVLVSIEALAEAFFNGVDKFLINIFANKERASIAEQRLKKLVHLLPFEKDNE
jgi:hypothetical protein